MRKRGIDIGGRRRNLGQQEQDDEDRRSDIKHDLDQVAPDHRIEAAHKSEGEAEDQQNKRGDDDMLGRDVEEEDHRNGDRSKIEARPAGKHPPDQIHGACRSASGRAEPGLEQFIDGGGAHRIKARHQDGGNKPRADQRADHARQIGIIAPEAIVGDPQKCCCRLHGRQNRHRNQPCWRAMAGQKIIIRILHVAPR